MYQYVVLVLAQSYSVEIFDVYLVQIQDGRSPIQCVGVSIQFLVLVKISFKTINLLFNCSCLVVMVLLLALYIMKLRGQKDFYQKADFDLILIVLLLYCAQIYKLRHTVNGGEQQRDLKCVDQQRYRCRLWILEKILWIPNKL